VSTLFIKSIPVDLSKEQLLAVLNKSNDVLRLIVSDVNATKRFVRMAWVECINQDAAATILNELNGYKFPNGFEMLLSQHKPNAGRDPHRKVKFTPHLFSTPDRIALDLDQAARLTKALDAEKLIEHNPLLAIDSELKADLKVRKYRE